VPQIAGISATVPNSRDGPQTDIDKACQNFSTGQPITNTGFFKRCDGDHSLYLRRLIAQSI
jgi:hypothetical protein